MVLESARTVSQMSGSLPTSALILHGVRGYLAGQTYRIRHGENLTVGRSRSCHVSLQRSDRFAGAEAAGDSFRKTSRRHLRIAFPHPDLVEIEDLSRNGTIVDGARVDKVIVFLSDLRGRAIEIEFGENEKLRLAIEEPGADGAGNGASGS
jgi:hypothetical protein